VWILASVAIGAITLLAARVVAPAWAVNTNETATVVVAEVYAILIATLYWVFGGSKRAWSVLRSVQCLAVRLRLPLSPSQPRLSWRMSATWLWVLATHWSAATYGSGRMEAGWASLDLSPPRSAWGGHVCLRPSAKSSYFVVLFTGGPDDGYLPGLP
jgi:hypothetical protein